MEMASCELCGKDGTLVSVIVESIKLNVCESCSKYGKVAGNMAARKVEDKKFFREEVIEIVIDDFSSIVKSSRERKFLTQKELAVKLNEKESVIAKIEQGSLKPSLDLARKLEKFLGIKLMTNEKLSEASSLNVKTGNLTIGDFLKK